ncbi:hydrolase, partial [Streptomyces sp. SID5914]|nr:hydrolase [Streptomyces sp. SID5914]
MPDSQPQPPHSPSPSGPADRGSLLLSGARLTDGRTVDVRLHGGRIEAVGTAGSLTPRRTLGSLPPGGVPGPGPRPGSDGHLNPGGHLDLGGYLLLPAPADPHVHADTALTADA